MPKFNLGWLKDKNGEKFAPKTFINQVVDYDGITLEEKLKNDKIIAPLTAEIGQQLIVKEVDENGKPIDWECVERPCYIDGERINILVDGLVDFQALSSQNVASCSVSIDDITLKPGNIYNITYNNVLYENLTLVDNRIGESADAALEYWYGQNKYYEYPFYIISMSNDNYKWINIFLCGERISRTEYFKIEEIEPIYVKLDNNYLEDNIPKINSAKVGQIIVVESVDENGKPNSFSVKNELDLSGYVTTSRYATSSQVGLVRTNTYYGTKMSGQYIQTDKATTSDISSKSNQYKPIVPYTLDYAIKCGLGANKLTWTEEEKTKARNVIGALGASDMIQSNWEQYDSSQLDYIKNRPFYNDYKYEDFSTVVNCESETSSTTRYSIQQIHNYLLSPNLIEYIYLYTSSGVKLASLVYDSEDENYLYYKDTTEGYTLVVYKQSTEVSFLTKASSTEYNRTCNIRYITSTSIVQLDEKFIPNNIPKIATASVGQILEVEEIDNDGKPIKWKAVDKASAADGEDGFSPIATVEQTEIGATISITDKNGTTTATVKHGEDGNTPYIDEEGYIVYGSDEIIPVNVVKFDSQNLTESQKTQARENIGAVSLEEMSKLSKDIANLKENGTGSGATTAQANSLWAIIQKSAFAEVLTDAELNAFKTAWGIESGGEVEPDVPDEPIEPDNPEVTLTSISATYTGGEVAVGTSVNSLTGITVKATYSDGSTTTVTDYTLSGTIAEGSNTITVSYGGKTTTFTVTGVAESGGESTAVNLMITGDLGIFSDLGVYTGYTGYYNADAKTLQLTPRSESMAQNAHLKITPFVEAGKSYTLFIGYDNRSTALSSAGVKYSATTEYTNTAIPVYKQGAVGNVTGGIEYIQFTVPDDAQTLYIMYQTTERKETTVVNVALYEGTYTEMP